MSDSARGKHLAGCRARAVEYLNAGGNLEEAVRAMVKDLNKRKDTKCAAEAIASGMNNALNSDDHGVRRWIEGFT